MTFVVRCGDAIIGHSDLEAPDLAGASGVFRPAPAFEGMRDQLRPYSPALVYWDQGDPAPRWRGLEGRDLPPAPPLAITGADGRPLDVAMARVLWPEDYPPATEYVLQVETAAARAALEAEGDRLMAEMPDPQVLAQQIWDAWAKGEEGAGPCERCGREAGTARVVVVRGYLPGRPQPDWPAFPSGVYCAECREHFMAEEEQFLRRRSGQEP